MCNTDKNNLDWFQIPIFSCISYVSLGKLLPSLNLTPVPPYGEQQVKEYMPQVQLQKHMPRFVWGEWLFVIIYLFDFFVLF